MRHRFDEPNGQAPAAAEAAPIIALPQIGAQSTLADLLSLLGHPPVARSAALEEHFTNRRVHRGQTLVFANQALENLYVVLSGSFKSTLAEADGTQQVVGFPMRGDLIGLDAIRNGRYPVSLRALEESNVAVLPYQRIAALGSTCPALEQTLMAAVSTELLRNYQVMRAIGVLGAEARLVRFLNIVGERGERFGFSASVLRLTMTRADIASYLGMSLETVSRAFSSLAARGVLDVRGRTIRVPDRQRLRDSEAIEPHSLQRERGTHAAAAPRTSERPHLAAGRRSAVPLVN